MHCKQEHVKMVQAVYNDIENCNRMLAQDQVNIPVISADIINCTCRILEPESVLYWSVPLS